MGERLRGEVWGWGRVKRDKHAAHRKFLSLHRQSIPCPSPAQIHAVKTDQGSITLTELKVDTSMLELVIKWVQSLKDFLLFLAFSFSFFFFFPERRNSLRWADKLRYRSMCFPALGYGIVIHLPCDFQNYIGFETKEKRSLKGFDQLQP